MKSFFRSLIVTALAGLMSAPPAFAQLEEIIVTATRREESLQDVPISVTALTGAALQEGGFSDMDDLSVFIPNLYMRDTFVGQRLAIRGIGTSPSNEAFEQAVAQFHDGIYYGRDNLGQNTFFDLERLEVVRGPQPTFAGQSATAGALNTISRRGPGDTLQGNISLAYGSDEESTIEFGVGGPLSETFGLRVAGRAYELGDAGYTQATTGNPLGIRDNSAFRLTGVWTPSDNFELTLKYETQDVWQVGTPAKFSRCDLNPATSLGNPFLSAGFGAMCAIDHLYNGVSLEESNGVTGSGGFQDIWDAVAAIDAANGITDPTDPRSWTPAASPIARNMNQVREFLEPEERDHQGRHLSGRIRLADRRLYAEFHHIQRCLRQARLARSGCQFVCHILRRANRVLRSIRSGIQVVLSAGPGVRLDGGRLLAGTRPRYGDRHIRAARVRTSAGPGPGASRFPGVPVTAASLSRTLSGTAYSLPVPGTWPKPCGSTSAPAIRT